MSENIFEYAVKNKLRFPSSKGELTIEQLFDVPLRSRSGFDLESVAQAIDTDLEAMGKRTYVRTNASNQKRQVAEAKLEIVKQVIEEKLAAEENAKKASEKADQRRKILEILEDKQDESLKGKSEEELRAMLNSLES